MRVAPGAVSHQTEVVETPRVGKQIFVQLASTPEVLSAPELVLAQVDDALGESRSGRQDGYDGSCAMLHALLGSRLFVFAARFSQRLYLFAARFST